MSQDKTPLRVGIAGLGTVGSAAARILATRRMALSRIAGRKIVLAAVSARERSRDRGINLDGIEWFDDPVALAGAPQIDLVVELIGGEDGPSHAMIKAAIGAGKGVVTANKALLAKHGIELAKAAEKSGVPLAFEAAVAGGIPIIKTLREALSGNEITRIQGILNGTCNYILSR
ncbi:MAG: homoserine dehydrogenase, partial [Hyphomicrobiales bacterium]|nr:homoserine dehydrogenase [Hyphomicrobiales bacterium]